jgi:hypothetical protein
MGKTHIRRQQFCVAGVEDVVVEVREVGTPWPQLFDVGEGFFQTEMRGVRFDADAVRRRDVFGSTPPRGYVTKTSLELGLWYPCHRGRIF